jgi:Protein of unknown function (DUF1569)
MAYMKKLETKVQELTQYLSAFDKIDQTISSASVGWHIEHSLLVIKQITSTVAQSDSSLYQKKFNFSRSWVLNYIPRGKAKAPKIVLPGNDLNQQLLEDSIKHTFQALNYLKDCQENQYFMHPYFGALNKNQTIRFLSIHTHHHLKIIADIIKRK